mmetsp:Transcript_11584/g.45008  ORF Transcript_11584/g.45008 Transcript_11584/m.45008 type:complete len:249 (-) Transcript_11584:1141-1887(-)
MTTKPAGASTAPPGRLQPWSRLAPCSRSTRRRTSAVRSASMPSCRRGRRRPQAAPRAPALRTTLRSGLVPAAPAPAATSPCQPARLACPRLMTFALEFGRRDTAAARATRCLTLWAASSSPRARATYRRRLPALASIRPFRLLMAGGEARAARAPTARCMAGGADPAFSPAALRRPRRAAPETRSWTGSAAVQGVVRAGLAPRETRLGRWLPQALRPASLFPRRPVGKDCPASRTRALPTASARYRQA